MSALIRCLCGHLYDPEEHSACPECGRERKSADAGNARSAAPPPPPPPSPPPTSPPPAADVPAASPAQATGWLKPVAFAVAGLLVVLGLIGVFSGGDDAGDSAEKKAGDDDAGVGTASSCAGALGKWNWYTGGFVVINQDKRAYFQPTIDSPPAMHGDWTCDEDNGDVSIAWMHGYTDTFKVYDGGRVVTGKNNVGVDVSGTRYVDPTAGMPQLQVKQIGSRYIPQNLVRLIEGASTVARNWRADAYPVGLRIREDSHPNPDAFYVQFEFYSPSEGTGLWISSHRTRNRMNEAGTVRWSTEPLPTEFIDLPEALRIARDNGLRGRMKDAWLEVDRNWRPPQPIWRIRAEMYGEQPPPIHAVSGQVMR